MYNQQHLDFLKRFPHLTDWLNINGYTLIYAIKDEFDQIHSVWSDRSSEQSTDGTTDARNWITIIYCEQSDVVDVYKRVGICAKGEDQTLAAELTDNLPGSNSGLVIDSFDDSMQDLLF